MAEKYQVSDAPPPYAVYDPPPQQTGPVIVLDKNEKGVFHTGARFNEFAKPHIPPPPPGVAPNALQQMQIEKGNLEIVMPQTHENQGFTEEKS